MLRHLAPIIIPETVGNPPTPNAAYRVVEELVSAIKAPEIKNIAVSADYGAGKSSVVETAKAKIIKEEDIHWWRFCRKKKQTKFLIISLAQLNAVGSFSKYKGKTNGDEAKPLEWDKDIEYSLLQQLLYYDLPSKTPKSRFYRLGRVGLWEPLKWAGGIILAILAYMILFEPERYRVYSFYQHFAIPQEQKFWADCIAVLVLAWVFISFCIWLVRKARIRIGKVKVKDAEVEVNTLSVFNQYLDEIIYFFASTRYNVVVFEDLDRFASTDTSRIFGKLRELNKILNNSQYLKGIIKREITFVYSVRDDLFDATRRVKFFDYIVPVIPVVNSYNAYEKLSEYLEEEDKKAFDGKDLLNLCDYFEDLRLIINIVNEYDLYKKVIRLEDFKLSRKKLFGLIVYKNYSPHDFILLHNHRGVLAGILDKKKQITEEVINARERRKQVEIDKLNSLKTESAEWEKRLRKEYVDAAKNQAGYSSSMFTGFEFENGTHVPFERVIEEPSFFEELMNDKFNLYGGNGQIYSIKGFDGWQKVVHGKPYQERLKMNPYIKLITNQQTIVDSIRGLKFSSFDSFATIISEETSVLDGYLNKEATENHQYISKKRHPLLRFLLTHDFVDEHYLDYITFFYQNSISVEDKRFILNITSLDEASLPYTFRLQNPVSVADRFELSDFKTNARLLNVDLALSLTREGDEQKANRNALQRLAASKGAIDFVLAVYERYPGDDVDLFMTELLARWDFGVLIQTIEDQNDARLPLLREINIRYANLNDPEMYNVGFQTWMNGHFGFLSMRFEAIGEPRLREWLNVYKIKFSKMNLLLVPSTFADFIIKGGHYSINTSNVENITAYLGILDEYREAGYTTLYNCKNQDLASSFRRRPQDYIKVFPSTSVKESSWAKAMIAAEDKISPITRKEYLLNQNARIQNATDLKDSALDFVFKHSLILPTWRNIYYLCFEMHHNVPKRFLTDNTLVDFLQLKPEEQNNVVGQWVFSNTLPFDVYERVVITMYGFKKIEPGVDPRRIEVLVNKGLLLFNPSNYSDMKEYYPSISSIFVTANINTYMGNVHNYTITTMVMSDVLNMLKSYAEKADYISKHPVIEGSISEEIADTICSLIYNHHIQFEQVEEKLLVEAIRNSSKKEETGLFVARKALFGLPYEPRRCREILLAMGGEYARICEPGLFSWMTMGANNNRIAKYLYDNSFIKGYNLNGTRIKIIKQAQEQR